MVMNTTLCFMWGYSIGLNFKRQTSDHFMRTNYRGSWFPLFFLTNLLTWNLKCKLANQPSTFCQHGPTGSDVCVSLDVCSLMREKTIYWIESCCGLCGPAKTLEPITGTITDVFSKLEWASLTKYACRSMESDTSLALLLDILCNSQCVKEQDGSAKDWKNKKCSFCGIYITPILLLLITKKSILWVRVSMMELISYFWESVDWWRSN